MPESDSAFGYLAKAIDGYRQAAQTFARDALIVIGLVALTTAFVFFPYLRSAEEEQTLKGQIAGQETARNATSALLGQMTNFQAEFTRTRQDIGQLAVDAAARLSRRLSDFAGYVRALSAHQGTNGVSNVLRRSPVEQFTLPNAIGETNPRMVLHLMYGLSDEDIASLTPVSTGPVSPTATNQAETIALKVFHKEIDQSYEQLNAAIQTRIEQLNQTTRANLTPLRKPLANLNVPFPDEQIIQVKFSPVPRPKEDSRFYTRSGKGETLGYGVSEVETTIDAAAFSLQELTAALGTSQRALNESLEQLAKNKKEVEERIQAMQDGVGQVQKELTQVSVPFNWMPMNVSTFVKAFPALGTLAFLILAVRFARLSKFRLRLIREMSQAKIKREDIDLALSVPDVTLDFLGPIFMESKPRLRLLSVLFPLAILGFFNFILLRTKTSPVFGPSRDLGILLVVEAFGIVTFILIYRSFSRLFSREPQH